MKRLLTLTACVAAVVLTTSAYAQRRIATNFASDFQTVPVMANVPGVGGQFQSYVALLNPTSSSFAVNATLYDSTGVPREATITLGPGELKTYTNFLDTVFRFSGGGTVTFASAETAGGTHNNRFIVSTEITSNRYNTMVPVLEFPGTSSRSFSAGITVDSRTRTNVGCHNQSGVANRITATIYDASGRSALGTATLDLAPHAWGQTAVTAIVSNGYVQFDPQEAAVCYAVVVDNATNDGRFINANEYQP